MLAHAVPNPFNPVTKIAYSVRESGPVTIEVYNVAGKVIRTGMDDAGTKCASGVYFYRMNTPTFSESHKMVMLK